MCSGGLPLAALGWELLRRLAQPLERRLGLPAWSPEEAHLTKLRAWRRAR